jgi:hypothetical protein
MRTIHKLTESLERLGLVRLPSVSFNALDNKIAGLRIASQRKMDPAWQQSCNAKTTVSVYSGPFLRQTGGLLVFADCADDQTYHIMESASPGMALCIERRPDIC